MRRLIAIVLLFFVFFQPATLKSQDLLTSTDLSKIRVDNLSEEDILKIRTQLQINNLTIEQVEPLALSKGMGSIEFAKLKTRLASPAQTQPAQVKDTDKKNYEQNRTEEIAVNN